ncbi:ATP-binding response regulator [Lacinutrix salivirga]
MLSNYKKYSLKSENQFLLVDKSGFIIENDTKIFSGLTRVSISIFHPFFESLIPLINSTDQTLTFNCVHFSFKNKTYRVDVTLQTFSKKPHAYLIINDLSEHYENNLRMSQTKNESEIKSQLLEIENNLLAKKERFKSEFLTNFSHNIMMPIYTITFTTSILNNSNINEAQRHSLGIIDTTSNQLKKMLNTLLDLSIIETGYFVSEHKVFNIYNLTSSLTEKFSKKFKENNITFNYKIDTQCPKFLIGNKFRITQVLDTILDNAYNYTLTGEVSFKVSIVSNAQNNITLQFLIEDTGIGIDNTHHNSIFESFYKVKNALTTNGKGLGLSIAKQLSTAMKGELNLKSEIGKGSAFKVTLPLKIAEHQQELEHKKAIAPKSKTESKYKILIAEYSEIDQISLINLLNTENEIEIHSVKTGDDVINSMITTNYNLIILNTKLPTMDGIDTSRFIRHSTTLLQNKTPIITITNNKSKTEEANCISAGVNAYLTKPLHKKEFLSTVKDLLK